MSKYQAAAEKEANHGTGNGLHMVPPMPESLKEMKN